MRLDVLGVTFAFAVAWGAAVVVTAAANLVWPSYGEAFLRVVASIYPGYHVGGGVGSVIVAGLYSLLDAALAGALYAWLYNLAAGRRQSHKQAV
jgi:hypothetical protein